MNKIIFFEGVDCVGKTTVMKEFNKITDFRYMCLDRGIISYFTYAEIFQRKVLKYPEFMLQRIEPISIVVYLYADERVLTKRMKDTGHPDYPVHTHLAMFEKNIANAELGGFRIIRQDTSLLQPDRIADIIYQKVLEICNDDQ